MIKNRKLSFFVVIIVYVIATIVAVTVFNLCNYGTYLNLFVADFCATVVVFIASLLFKNSSVYDPYWSVQPIVILVALTIKWGISPLSLYMLIVVVFWGVRLTANWAYTFQNLDWQDWRYTMLKEKTGVFYPIINFLGIHLFPTIVVYFCVSPAVYIIQSNKSVNLLFIFGCLLSLFGAVMQMIADIQMHKYRKNRIGNFIRTGLWKYSRHPNYLGEILMWWGIAIACLSLYSPIYFIFGALLNTLMFLFVSIPMADKRQSKKEGFEEYKAQTRALLPIAKH